MADREKNTFLNDTRVLSELPDGRTRQFSVEERGKEPTERCEERSAIRDDSTGIVVWRMLRPALILLVSALLVGYLCFFVYRYINDNYVSPVTPGSTEVKKVEIVTGSSLSKIATLLYEQGLIRNKLVFQLFVDFSDKGSKLQAGTYELSPNMTIKQIMDIIAEGDGGEEILKIVFTEGMTAEDIAQTLVAKGAFDEAERKEFLELCNDASAFSDYSFVASLANTAKLKGRKYLLEGYLFPDTYEIYTDAKPKDIIRKLLDRFDEKFTMQYEERAKAIGMSVDQVVTLASMIEWESLPKDFSKVSAVFNNRINKKMQLGSCATLRYVTGQKKFVYTAEEMAIDSPYNTYKVVGLPLGPIANPGKNAIYAALYPDEEFVKQKYLYFLNKDKTTGELVFAKTLEEQNANKKKYGWE